MISIIKDNNLKQKGLSGIIQFTAVQLVRLLGLLIITTALVACSSRSHPDADDDGIVDIIDVDADGDGLIEIRTAALLNRIRNNLDGTSLSGYSEGCPRYSGCIGYELIADIDLNDLPKNASGSNWRPIGSCIGICESIPVGSIGGFTIYLPANRANFFKAIFDGNGHTISNLNINTTEAMRGVGLFGVISSRARIRNVHMHNINIYTPNSNFVGGLIGFGDGADIRSSSVTANQITGGSNAGGLMGRGSRATIRSTSATANRINGDTNVGGLVGNGDEAMVRSSSANANRITGDDNVGGLMGRGKRAMISSSSAIVNQTNGRSNVGGLIGEGDEAMVSSSSAKVTQINGDDNVGGLLGEGDEAMVSSSSAKVTQITGRSRNVGGMVGSGNAVIISSSSAVVDNLNGNRNVGGLVGWGVLATIYSSSAVVSQLRGSNTVGGLVGRGASVDISSSSAIINQLSGDDNVGGLIGSSVFISIDIAKIDYSLAIIASIDGSTNVSPLVGAGFSITTNSYWRDGVDIMGIQNIIPAGNAQSTTVLQAPTIFRDIYTSWANSYCNPITGEYRTMEIGDLPPDIFESAWDLGTSIQYPVLNCLPITPAEQRAQINRVIPNPPGTTKNLRTALSPTSITITWDIAPHATYYNVSRRGGAVPSDVTVMEPRYEDTNVTLDNDYTYSIIPCNKVRCSAVASISVNYRVPTSAPTDLTATLGANLINLAWTASADDTFHYEVSRNGSVLNDEVASASYVDMPTTEDLYTYGVRTCNDAGCSEDTASTMIQFFLDDDGDGVFNSNDNCPMVANSNQKNTDNDDNGGDACDDNDDNDAFTDLMDVDDDGNGLIDIYNAAELDAVRHNLNGTGLDLTGVGANSTGCGGARNASGALITDKCSGYELMADIDLSSYDNWQPIGSCGDISCEESISQFFVTEFNGNNYTISNLTISISPEIKYGVALFGAIASSAELINVHMRNVNIYADNSFYIGGLVGWGLGATINYSSVKVNQITGKNGVGGLIGYGRNAMISSSSTVFNLTASFGNAGGLVGDGTGANISSSSAVVTHLTGGSNAGGLIGFGQDATVSSSSAVVDNLNGNTNVGGLIGFMSVFSGLAMVSSSSAIVDNLNGDTNVGGLIGSGGNSVIINSSLAITMNLDGKTAVGGLVGIGIPNTHNSYWDNDALNAVGAPATNTAGAGKSTNELQNPVGTGFANTIYSTWANAYCNPTTGEYRAVATGAAPADFKQAWDLGTDSQYPVLTCLPIIGQREIITR